jgi:nucleoside-diphosphate-sugar epimerase
MSSAEERVFVIGASGEIGSGVVRGLVSKGVKTTAYARNATKTNDLFKAELTTGLLNIVIGDYSTPNVYEEAIKGHTRLYILLVGDFSKPALMSEVKGFFGKVAYEQGVRQIVDLSSIATRIYGKQGVLGYIHTSAEEKLWALAEENPQQRSLVILRPGFFMTNHFMGDVHHIKKENKIMSAGTHQRCTHGLIQEV